MRTTNSLRNRLMALLMSIVMVLGMLPANVLALNPTAVAQIGDTPYDTLAEALAAVPTGTNQVAPAQATTIKLLSDTAYAFDVGSSTGATTMNLKLDLNGNTLTLSPSVGSVGTKSSGIRVLAYSKLEIANGTVLCSSQTADNVKVGIANYGTLTLTDVDVKSGDLTIYTVNNRGALTLNGKTAIDSGSTCAITNDPYDLYYTTDVNASVTCNSSEVAVESMLLERYDRNSANNGGVALNISAGYFGKIVEDGNTSVGTDYQVTGGTIGVSTTEELEFALSMVNAGGMYSCPEKPVTIKLLGSIDGSFDVGTSTGKAPKNILLDLNGNTLTLKPGIGSYNTKSNGIRVLAYSKLEIKNGTIICSSEEADNVKVGIANYGELILDSVAMEAGDLTQYTVNNRGALTLKGNTSVDSGSVTAITNDPYNLYYTTDVDASITCDSSNVYVESIMVERYERNVTNKGGVTLNISAGYVGKIEEDGNSSVGADYNISGGSFGSDISNFLPDDYEVVKDENNNYVVKSSQENFGFKQEEYTVTFGDNGNKFAAAVENATGEVTYSFVTATDVAQINAQTGELTILKAGTVQVKAVAAGNAQYAQAEDTYTLVIEPAYADVNSFSGGTVTGSGTNNTVVSIDQAILEWVEKDASIGRTEDGWWVGIKIIAPDGVDLSKAVYQRRSGGTFDGAEVKHFVPENDRYLGMWGLITAEYLENFSTAGKKMNYVWRFSWDGDDVYEQTIAITIDPSGITLKQSGFAFGIDEETITYGESYTARQPSGGQASNITYSVENVSEANATIAAIDPLTGALTVNRAGTVKITATLSGDRYESISDSYILVIEKADQPDFDFDNPPVSVTWQEEILDALALKNGLGTGALTWSILGQSDVATVDPVTGKITLLKAGTFTLQVQKACDDCYNASAVIETEIEVLHKAQNGFGFSTESDTITYNDSDSVSGEKNKYTVLAAGGQSVKDVVYEVISGNAATVDEDTGVITILKAGTVVIKATRPEDTRYAETSDTFELTIEKDEQSFTFNHDKQINEKYGLTSFETQITKSDLNSGTVTYAVSGDNIGATVNNLGVVSFGNSVLKVGTITVTVTMVENECYLPFTDTYTITLTYETVPAISYTLDGNKIIAGSNWFTGNVTIAAPSGYQISYSNDLTGNTWDASVTWTVDGEDGTWAVGSAPIVYLKKVAAGQPDKITDAIYVSDLKKDTINPDGLEIFYQTSVQETIGQKLFGFDVSTVKVTVIAADSLSGISKMEYSMDKGNTYTEITASNNGYEFFVEPQARGQIWLRATDIAGNAEVYKHVEDNKDKILVVDNIAPEVEIEFTGDRQDAVKADNGTIITREIMTAFDATTRFIYNGSVTATIKVKEANFFPDNDDMTIKITCDGTVVTDLATAGISDSGWQLAEGVYTRTFVMTKDGDYQLIAEYKDHSLNDMQWESKEYAKNGQYHYESNIHTIDTTAPVYEVTYNNNEVIQTLNGRDYFKASREATIKVTDRNFRPSEVVFNVTATDIAGNAVDYTYSNLKSWSDWTKGADGITWTAKVPFAPDANYTVSFSYDDIANNKTVNKDNVEEVYNAQFTVDSKIPTGLKVEYRSKDAQVLNKILNAITFGNYKAAQEVVLTMTDATAGIDYIELTVTPEGPASATNLVMPENLVINADGSVKSGTKGFIGTIRSSANNGNLTLSFDVPAQFRGKISFVAYDKSSNRSDSHADPGVLVVDTIAPGYTISYNPSNVVNVSDMKDMTSFNAANGIIDITSTNASYVMYFSGDAVAKLEIVEANFDPSEVVLVVQDANGNAVQGWTQTGWVTTTKAGQADVHSKSVTITEEGDYQIKVYYQDHSMNTPVDYLSQWIVVDKTAPVIDVKYSNTDVKNTIEGRDYFSAAQTSTITVKEHNFRPDDVVIKVTAKDVLGADVLTLNADGTVKAYADQGADRKSWTAYKAGTWRVQDDAFIITLNYTADANYTFDIEYQDLAKNKAADYEQDLFTVDATAPKNLTVDYSTSVFEQIKESITFGYYNAMMTVTITAEDDTSGIHHFAYSYIKGKDVSGVNAELLNQAIKEAEITYDGKKATAIFNIPKMVLGADNQFNGTVEFTAYDRSEVSTELKDSTVIVVDNITPTSKITYNAPVQTVNGISYYNGDINATIVITEANFDAKDAIVTVTKDGKDFPVNVIWKDDSADTHTGTFTLTEDGDYVVSVQYKDKSGNQMTSYKSNELTLDATKPTIQVSNIKANSANKDEKYGFVITVNDTNLDVASLKPVLKAVARREDGVYVTVDIDLGNAVTVVNGQTYTYTVEDLPNDGLYTLTCSVKDMSANDMSQIVLDDGQSYDQVQFSINRNGSAFAYGNQFSEELVGQYYIYSVDEDVVIVEVNVDPVEEYKVTLNGKELVDGTDYTTAQTSQAGEWSKRTYTIKKTLFEAEGEYSIVISSTDKAESTAFSDVKNLSLAFVVDQTKPTLTITGLEAGGRYQTDAQTVTLIPLDEGGRLNSLKVLALDSNGNPLKDDKGADISVRFDMSGEKLLKYLEENDGKVTFTVPEGLNNQVKIVCNDCAVNAENLTNEYNELFERVTVSPNQFVIFYANTPLFVGTIAGILAAAGLIIFLIKRKGGEKGKTAAKA